MKLRITLSANAGISLDFGMNKILIDAFHEDLEEGFSTLSSEEYSKLISHEDFEDAEVLFYTHAHHDHYSENLTKKYIMANKECMLVAPENILPDFVDESRRIVLTGFTRAVIGGIRMNFVALPHEGRNYKNIPNYGSIIEVKNRRIFVSGDAAIATPEVRENLKGVDIDLAILNFLWITSSKGRDFIYKHIRPKKILLYHLPHEKDDIFHYCSAVKYAIEHLDKDLNISYITEFLESVEMDI